MRTHLVLGCRLLAKCHDRVHADRQVVSTHKQRLTLLDQAPVLLQVLQLVAVCGRKIRAHAPVVPGDDHTTPTRGGLLVVAVAVLETSGPVASRELLRRLVLADAANEHDRRGREEVLRSTGSVLGGATRKELGIAGQQVGVDAKVLLLREDGIVGLQSILLEKRIVAWLVLAIDCSSFRSHWPPRMGGMESLPLGLDIQERVLEAEKLVRCHGRM